MGKEDHLPETENDRDDPLNDLDVHPPRVVDPIRVISLVSGTEIDVPYPLITYSGWLRFCSFIGKCMDTTGKIATVALMGSDEYQAEFSYTD